MGSNLNKIIFKKIFSYLRILWCLFINVNAIGTIMLLYYFLIFGSKIVLMFYVLIVLIVNLLMNRKYKKDVPHGLHRCMARF